MGVRRERRGERVICGIVGIRNRDGRPIDENSLRRFTLSLAHRGPDGEGIYVDSSAHVGLGHRRLSIIDPSDAGAQPMTARGGRYTVVFNGAIYNFIEVRRELIRVGYSFSSDCDTEVIAAAYDRWGASCQYRFNGMWAFALWDERERKLFISRDRFGVKPLYYVEDGRRFAFASELKAFLARDGFAVREETVALARALRDPLAAEQFAQTPLRGVMKLLPGRQIIVTSEGAEVTRWWNTLDHLVDVPQSLAAQGEALRDLLLDAVRLRLRSDVSIGIALSGGLDSSSVLASVASQGAHAPAFTATFVDTPLDELAHARRVANEFATTLHEIDVDPIATAAEAERIAFDIEEVTLTDPSPIWTLYREMRARGVTVALNGDAADELFGGYVHHVDHALSRARGLRAPRRFRDLIETRCGLMGGGDAIVRARLAVQHDPLLHALASPLRAVRGRRRRIAPHAHRAADPNDAAASGAAYREAVAVGLSPLGAHLYEQFSATTLPGILRMFDRASMAHGIEIRNAFLDWRVVCFAFSLPDTSRIGGGYTKRVLREAMRGIVPETVRTRRDKIGFNAPLPTWFSGPRAAWLWERVNAPSFLESDLWDGTALRDAVGRKRAGEAWSWGEGESLWSALACDLQRTTYFSGDRR